MNKELNILKIVKIILKISKKILKTSTKIIIWSKLSVKSIEYTTCDL